MDLLLCPTPDEWLAAARERLPELLIDHANCERKAAVTALGLIHRYPFQRQLVNRMSRLAREELRHFEQVLRAMDDLSIPYRPLSSSRYAGELKKLVAESEPERLLDQLLMGAFIEARSLERFGCLISVLEPGLSRLYERLLESERRHRDHYLELAAVIAPSPDEFADRRNRMAQVEAELISSPDQHFRFHSGVPN